MEAVLAAAITGCLSVVAAYVSIRRPMKKEHAENKVISATVLEALGVGQGDRSLAQRVDDIRDDVTEVRADLSEHLRDHARGEFD